MQPRLGDARLEGAGAVPARATAPFDPTGYWVAIVSEDWRWRMVTPAKGDCRQRSRSAPRAARVAEAWIPAKDEAAGEAVPRVWRASG